MRETVWHSRGQIIFQTENPCTVAFQSGQNRRTVDASGDASVFFMGNWIVEYRSRLFSLRDRSGRRNTGELPELNISFGTSRPNLEMVVVDEAGNGRQTALPFRKVKKILLTGSRKIRIEDNSAEAGAGNTGSQPQQAAAPRTQESGIGRQSVPLRAPGTESGRSPAASRAQERESGRQSVPLRLPGTESGRQPAASRVQESEAARQAAASQPQRAEAEQQLAALKAQQIKAEQQLSALRKQKEEAEGRLRSLQAQSGSVRQELARVREQSVTAQNQLKALEQELPVLKARQKEAEERVRRRTEEREAVKARLEECRKKLDELEAANELDNLDCEAAGQMVEELSLRMAADTATLDLVMQKGGGRSVKTMLETARKEIEAAEQRLGMIIRRGEKKNKMLEDVILLTGGTVDVGGGSQSTGTDI